MGLRKKIVRVRGSFDAGKAYSEAVADQIAQTFGPLSSRKIKIEIFDPKDDRLIAKQVSRRFALRARLITSGRWLSYLGPKEAEPTATEMRRTLALSAKRATQLIKALGMRGHPNLVACSVWLDGQLREIAAPDARSVEATRGYRHEMPAGELVGEVINGLIMLERWLIALERLAQENLLGESMTPRNRGSYALKIWVDAMRRIWRDVFERKDFGSRKFSRFLSAASAPTPCRLTEPQARELVRGRKGQSVGGGLAKKSKQTSASTRARR